MTRSIRLLLSIAVVAVALPARAEYEYTNVAESTTQDGRTIRTFNEAAVSSNGSVVVARVVLEGPVEEALILISGSAAPVVIATGGNQRLSPPAVNANGVVAWRRFIPSGFGTPGNSGTIFTYDRGTTRTVLSQNATYVALRDPDINDAGTVVFVCGKADSPNAIPRWVIETISTSGTSTEVLNATSVPMFAGIAGPFDAPTINGSGNVGFFGWARVDGTASLKRGLFAVVGGALQTILAPGSFELPQASSLYPAVFDDQNAVAATFVVGGKTRIDRMTVGRVGWIRTTWLDTAAPGSPPSVGWPVGSSGGALAFVGGGRVYNGADLTVNRLVGTGDTLSGRTIDLITLHGVTDNGRVVFTARFAGGGRALFRADPMPEPPRRERFERGPIRTPPAPETQQRQLPDGMRRIGR